MAQGTPKTPRRVPRPPVSPAVPGSKYVQSISELQEQLIGRAIVRWSRLEIVIDEVIWRFLKLDIPNGRVITSHLDASHKFKLLRGLSALHLTSDGQEQFAITMGKLEDLYAYRNLFAHCHWVTVFPDNLPAALSMRDRLPSEAGKSEVVATLFQRDLMLGIVHNIMAATNSLIKLRNDIESSPDKPFPLEPTAQ
jgi:hypothetical protein